MKVFIELVRKSDNSRSDPKAFTYTPSVTLNVGTKRPRLHGSFSSASSSGRRSFNSADIPATIPTTVLKLSDDFEKQSLNGENLSDYLKVESRELESMYAVAFPEDIIYLEAQGAEMFCYDANLSTDGPMKTNKQPRGLQKMYVLYAFSAYAFVGKSNWCLN